MKPRQKLAIIALAATLLSCPTAAWCQDAKKPFKSISTEQLKMILDSLNYEYKAGQGRFLIELSKPGENNVKYAIVVESFEGGQAIVVSMNLMSLEVAGDNARLAASMLQKVNDWNTESALSRAMRRQTTNAKKKEVFVPRLEADLDCAMGVTEQDINRLIQRFPAVLKEFELYMK